MKITALVHTRNEASFLRDCLDSLTWTDAVVVADMASTDGTRDLAIARGARLIDVPSAPIVEAVRDLALHQCDSDWVLIVDPDERVPPSLARRLRDVAQRADVAACRVPRKNYFLGTWIEHGFWPDYQVRFVRPQHVLWPQVVHAFPKIDGAILDFEPIPELALEHPGYCSDLGMFLEKGLRYSRRHAACLAEESRPEAWPYLLRRPLGEFYGRFFKSRAWRHGMHGLAWSLAMSLYELEVALHYWDLRGRPTAAKSTAGLRRRVVYECLRSNSKWLSALFKR